MSNFECPVVRVTIEPHPNADAIEIARIGDYQSIVRKGQFKDGDLAMYVPEMSLLPEWLLRRLGFWDDLNGLGRLSGAAGNRLKAIKLRGVLSQGLLVGGNCADEARPGMVVLSADAGPELGVSRNFDEGDNAAEFFGITKYEPTVPQNMAGRVAGGDLEATIGYDFENLKKHPDLFEDGMEVAITEKIHGTLLQVGLIPAVLFEGKSWAEKADKIVGLDGRTYAVVVTSKGQGAKGLMLDPADAGNLYVSQVRQLDLATKLAGLRFDVGAPEDKPIFLFGEIFGAGVQDLEYGQNTATFRAFDAYIGTRDDGYFMDFHSLDRSAKYAGINLVPLLYIGPYSKAIVAWHTDGRSTIPGAEGQIREGVVVKATDSARHPRLGRRIAKSVSEAYLLRKNATEYA